MRITKDQYGDYYLCLPIEYKLQSDSQAKEFTENDLDGVISLDPGVRTFMTGYDVYNQSVFHFAPNAIKKIEKVVKRIDKLESTMSKSQNKRKMAIRMAIFRLRKRLKNLVKDMHCKIALFLCQNYKLILLPKFETQSMSLKKSRKIGKKSVRQMMTLSHYKFQQRVIHKSKQFKNCKVIIVNESYTSKTCGKCGNLNNNLGNNKTFNCLTCHTEIDRDINGSRNILIKNYCK